jgi:hypothetical protein
MATIESAKQLETLTANLDGAMKALDLEKARIHDLLNSILPPVRPATKSCCMSVDHMMSNCYTGHRRQLVDGHHS